MRRLAIVCLLLAACASTRPSDSARLRAIAEEYWHHQLDQNPALHIKFGIVTRHLPDVSYAHAQREADFAKQLLGRLDAVDPKNLTSDERISLAILRWNNRLTVDGLPYFYYRFTVAPYTFQFLSITQIFKAERLTDAQRQQLLDELPRLADQLVENLRQAQSRGIVIPKPEVPLVKQTFAALTPAMPALQRVIDFVSQQEATAPDAIGLAQYPGGADAYRFFVRQQTSVDLTPQQIHELGLREVDRINREMQQVRDSLAFQGSKADFMKFLKTDPRFFAKTPDEVGERLTADLHKIEPHVPQYFSRFPKARYDVQRLNPALEGSITFGYYQQPTATDPVGHYYYNGSKLSERNLLFAQALIAHELIPGHHFQIARQEENESLPPFRRETFDTVFVEGWGEYAAFLGNEMGIYADPYDRYGRLMMDMLLSVRLVVDTGMNALGWSRERAAQFMRENTLLSETEIATETLRYAVDMPAQSLAYKIGSLKMIELRQNAEKQLGGRFDVKQFHEWIIGSGSMPLPVLEQHVAEEIRR